MPLIHHTIVLHFTIKASDKSINSRNGNTFSYGGRELFRVELVSKSTNNSFGNLKDCHLLSTFIPKVPYYVGYFIVRHAIHPIDWGNLVKCGLIEVVYFAKASESPRTSVALYVNESPSLSDTHPSSITQLTPWILMPKPRHELS